MIVPRHPERGAALAASLGAPRRALGQAPPAAAGFWIADTLGELGLLYRCVSPVLMGKSFGGGGGQNPWEAAQFGCAILCGPDMQNFADTVDRLSTGGAPADRAGPGGVGGSFGPAASQTRSTMLPCARPPWAPRPPRRRFPACWLRA